MFSSTHISEEHKKSALFRSKHSKATSRMAYDSDWSTSDGTSPRVYVVDSSIPESKDGSTDYIELTSILVERPRATGRFDTKLNHCHRMRLRNLSKVIWPTMLVIILLGWWLATGREHSQPRYGSNTSSLDKDLEGLQFIDASHPYIRVGYPSRFHSSTLLT